MPAISKLLIANRGEIAARVIRTARAMDIGTVAVFSDPPTRRRRTSARPTRRCRCPATPRPTRYLNAPAMIAAAQRTGADAVHPGYGFLSENAAFAQACADAGLIFVGPPPQAIEAMGSKIAAKDLMAAAGVPVLPGAVTIDGRPSPPTRQSSNDIGFPLLVKAAFGGGGRGMRVVRGQAELAARWPGRAARRRPRSATAPCSWSATWTVPRHIEVQIFGDTHGTVVHLFERECSIQRRYQKIIEEAPSPAVDEALRQELGEAAIAAGKAIGYIGAGTVEFVLDAGGKFYFLEVNTRLQVEHPVTELVTGLDLVGAAAPGGRGPAAARRGPAGHAHRPRHRGPAVRRGRGGRLPARHRHAARVRHARTWPGVRVDAGVAAGSAVGLHYDAMLAKVIAHGPTRDAARRRLARALAGTRLHGVTSNRDLLVGILREEEFQAGQIDTGYLTRHDPEQLARSWPDQNAPRLHALAAALAGQAARRAQAPVLRTIPSGWRNVPSEDQHVTFATGDGSQLEVRYRFSGQTVTATINGEPVTELLLRQATPDRVIADIGGIRREFTVRQDGGDLGRGQLAGQQPAHRAAPVPRPAVPGRPGSLLAPMPGTVVRLEVAPGTQVTAGTPIVVLEAMKMEHSVSAPHDGVVTDIEVTGGQQVDVGTVLAVVDILVADHD